jgi:HEAT repeat protein
LLSDTNEFVRAEAVRAISRFPQTSEHVIAQVIASLDDDSSGVRSAGAIALKLLGPLAEPRKEELADRIRQAPQSVGAIHLEAALSFMDFCKQATSDALASDDWFGRERAIRCASHMVDPPIELLEGLDALLDGADFEIQLAAAEAIRRLAGRAAHLKRRLRTRLASKQWAGNGPESMVRQHLIVAVELMGSTRRQSRPPSGGL